MNKPNKKLENIEISWKVDADLIPEGRLKQLFLAVRNYRQQEGRQKYVRLLASVQKLKGVFAAGDTEKASMQLIILRPKMAGHKDLQQALGQYISSNSLADVESFLEDYADVSSLISAEFGTMHG